MSRDEWGEIERGYAATGLVHVSKLGDAPGAYGPPDHPDDCYAPRLLPLVQTGICPACGAYLFRVRATGVEGCRIDGCPNRLDAQW